MNGSSITSDIPVLTVGFIVLDGDRIFLCQLTRLYNDVLGALLLCHGFDTLLRLKCHPDRAEGVYFFASHIEPCHFLLFAILEAMKFDTLRPEDRFEFIDRFV